MQNTPSPSSPQLNATVMASAGTGKTWLLVSRLLRLLLAGARPDGILAITFTRKAAAEMQSRLAERLLQLAGAGPEELAERLRELDITPNAEHMEQARRLYERMLQQRQNVRTTTFHAFCQEVLLRFPLEADVPPGFELLASDGELIDTAWQAMLAEASAQPDGQLAHALQFLLDGCGGLSNLRTALMAFVAHRGDWWAYIGEGEDPVQHATTQLHRQLGLQEVGDPLADLFSPVLETGLAEFAELLRGHPIDSNLKALDQIALARHPQLPLEERYRACRAAFLTQAGQPLARKPSKTLDKKLGEAGAERLLALHRQIAQALLNTADWLNAQQNWQLNQAWYQAGSCLLNHFQRLKREQRTLDFTDLEWQACQLLNRSDHAQWVQYKLDQRINHLLVDEFQDTNPTQWRLLLPLLQEMAAADQQGQRSVFLVGDAKQSIYRFRRAEPRLFQAAHEWLADHLQARTFPLHTSWRSAPAIMQCVNQVFGDEGPLAGVLRDFHPHQTHHLQLPGAVTVLPLIPDEDPSDHDAGPSIGLRNPLQQPRQIPQDLRYLTEGRQIAECIADLVRTGQPVGHGPQARPVDYGDIMILIRKRSHVGAYEQALREAHIPYIGAERGTLLESLEVRDMLALLEWLITPFNNLALATVLRSPLFACSDEDLITLASGGKGNWYPRLQQRVAAAQGNRVLNYACTRLSAWRELAGVLPIHDLLDRIYAEGDVLQRYQQAAPAHLRSRVAANLTRFIELALEIDSGRYPSLGHFIARLKALRERQNEAPDEAPASGDQQRVRLMTIHAAKGLEAPVVFLADCTNSDSSDKAWRALLDWPPQATQPRSFMLVGTKEGQSPLIREQVAHEQEENRRELANLLYVALTRPRQWLYISGVAPKKGEDKDSWYRLLRQAIDPLAETPLDAPCSLSNGDWQAVVGSHKQPLADSPDPADPALTRPLDTDRIHSEIAPSRSHGHTPYGSGDEDGRLRGTVIHRLLQQLTEASGTPEHIAAQVAAEFALDAPREPFRGWYRECRQLLDNPVLQRLFEASGGVEFFNEVPILYSQDGQTVHGIIDRLRLSEEEVWIIDYKSHRLQPGDTLRALAESYRQQLDYYAQGVARLWPQHRVRSLLLFTHSATLHEFTGAS